LTDNVVNTVYFNVSDDLQLVGSGNDYFAVTKIKSMTDNVQSQLTYIGTSISFAGNPENRLPKTYTLKGAVCERTLQSTDESGVKTYSYTQGDYSTSVNLSINSPGYSFGLNDDVVVYGQDNTITLTLFGGYLALYDDAASGNIPEPEIYFGSQKIDLIKDGENANFVN